MLKNKQISVSSIKIPNKRRESVEIAKEKLDGSPWRRRGGADTVPVMSVDTAKAGPLRV